MFLAVPAAAVGPELRRQLQLVPSSQLVPVEDLHVTLHFLGRQPSAWIERIAAVCDWPAIASFRLDLAGAGRFAGERAQQVLWVGVERSPQLAALHAHLAARLAALGLPLEARPWLPHLTVCARRCGVGRVGRGLRRREPGAAVVARGGRVRPVRHRAERRRVSLPLPPVVAAVARCSSRLSVAWRRRATNASRRCRTRRYCLWVADRNGRFAAFRPVAPDGCRMPGRGA